MNSSRTSKRRTGRQLTIGLTAAGVLAVGLAVPAFAAGTNAVTSVPAFINLANQGTVELSGTATSGVREVRVALDDGQNAMFDVLTTLSADSPTGKTWRVSVNANALADGPVAVFASFDRSCATPACRADRTVEKDTDAPEVPTASPDGPATFSAAHDVLIESVEAQARTHFTTGTPAPTPSASSPVVPGPYTVRTTQQVKAITYDLAGNSSPIMVVDYTVTAPVDLAAVAAQARAAAAAAAAAADAAAATAAQAKAAADTAAADAAARDRAADVAAAASAAAKAAGDADAAAQARTAAAARAAADAAAANAAAKADAAATAKAAAARAAAIATAKANAAAAAKANAAKAVKAAKAAARAAAKATPKVVSQTPAPNRTGVSRTGNVTATFNMGVKGVTGKSFTLRTKAGKAVAARVSYNSRTRVATLDPAKTLAAGTTYVATLRSSVKAVKSLSLTRWSFSTGPVRRG